MRGTSYEGGGRLTAIQFDSVSLRANERDILHNISGAFPKGHITTLVGPSGAGKTTILKLCNGLISPTNGNIYIEGEAINKINPIVLRKKCGIVLQNAPIIRGTVFENLALPRQLHNEQLSETEALQLLQDVHLEANFLQREASELSGGQKQKLAIARTLANRPSILLLDEITSALDPTSTKEIEQLILHITKKFGVTTIWITHNMMQARNLGDYTWILQNGQLHASGDVTLLSKSDHPVIEQLLNGGAV